jgi:hypothetical protein
MNGGRMINDRESEDEEKVVSDKRLGAAASQAVLFWLWPAPLPRTRGFMKLLGLQRKYGGEGAQREC